MRTLKFACPLCGQHIKCEEDYCGRQIACPVCAANVLVPELPAEPALALATGKVGVPLHATGAPRAPQPPPPINVKTTRKLPSLRWFFRSEDKQVEV